MSENVIAWSESIFNIVYLIIIWILVSMMLQRRQNLSSQTRACALSFMWAFVLLALGDSGHVGFRVWGYAMGGLDTYIQILGQNVSLVGLGRLTTAITLTVFYMLLLIVWRQRFNKPYGWFGIVLFAAGFVRLGIMAMPQNAWWQSSAAIWPLSLYRNLPLMLQGLGVAYLILRDAAASQDRTFTQIGILILISYAFYIPVILFARLIPAIGILMLPKTLVYVVIAWVVYTKLFNVSVSAPTPA